MPRTTPMADYLSERDGHLFVDDIDTTKLVEEFGSPLFVMSEQQLRNNARRFHAAFAKHWPDGPVDIMPANKANWNQGVWAVLADEGLGADIYSAGELHCALSLGLDPNRISVNGGGKTDETLRKCIIEGVRITVEELNEPERINNIAKELGKTAKIRLRVKPDFPGIWRRTDFAVESLSVDLGLQIYKAGIPAQYLEELGREVLKMSNVELVGLHFHSGRWRSDTWYWKKLMKGYAELILRLSKAWGGYRPQELDIGGGFAIEADPLHGLKTRMHAIETFFTYPFELLAHVFGKAGRYKFMGFAIEKLMQSKPGSQRAPTIEEYAEAAVTTFRDTLLKGGMDLKGIRLQAEPGRSFFGNAGIHLTSVKRFKKQTKPIKLNWVLTDTTAFFMNTGVIEFSLNDFRIANKLNAEETHVADVVGHSCHGDRILPTVKVPELENGDLIALLDMGAYQEISASNFNALPRPPVVLVNGSQADVIKRGETIEDVYARDIIPPHLRREEKIA
ncbi:hypothetical protein M3P21_01505 [Ruegeria sp. 2012CJ41-6]|uniref:Orn/DAP/Arg decarboxylase 2 N-terminal domain-containing protein n=1 Tax=Ruegeria spongiae TaxID=2942209 RepID=A0ABT0PX58_9RHOB|nr:hypothetical protein [Ruegeria spongiae]MCL6282191.1 hypothetical protein [Ruegeria spongiae]